jgi:hypothetical protein
MRDIMPVHCRNSNKHKQEYALLLQVNATLQDDKRCSQKYGILYSARSGRTR